MKLFPLDKRQSPAHPAQLNLPCESNISHNQYTYPYLLLTRLPVWKLDHMSPDLLHVHHDMAAHDAGA